MIKRAASCGIFTNDKFQKYLDRDPETLKEIFSTMEAAEKRDPQINKLKEANRIIVTTIEVTANIMPWYFQIIRYSYYELQEGGIIT